MRELPEGRLTQPVPVKVIRVDILSFDGDTVDYSHLIGENGEAIFANHQHLYSVDIVNGPYRGNYLFHKDELEEI